MRRRAVLGLACVSVAAVAFLLLAAFVGTTIPASPSPAALVPVRSGGYASLNWAGYAVTGPAGSVSDVKGSWVVPSVACTATDAYSAFWVGIDGFNSQTVEQTGTDSDCRGGQPTYYAWYEFYPKFPVTLSLTIHPGDAINAEVLYLGRGTFQVTLSDATTGGSASATQRLTRAARSSAEWIAEAPSSSSGVLPLADFGTVTFTNGVVTVSGVTGTIASFWPNDPEITMVTSSGAVKAQPSALSSSGSGFSVTWVSAGP